MKRQDIKLNGIPAVIFGDEAEDVFLFIHGKHGSKEEAASFAEIASPRGYQTIGIDLPEHGERVGEATRLYPWNVISELRGAAENLRGSYKTLSVRANSIGAWLAMMAYQDESLAKCLFVSPIVDMNRLIRDMMTGAFVSEERLEREREIETDFGETLSWEYYSYVKAHPIIAWKAPTCVLYAEKDNLTDKQTIQEFSSVHSCELTVYPEGEHWFHTDKQLSFLKMWEEKMIDQK